MSSCNNCGGVSKAASARITRHSDICSCIRCEQCDDVIGDTLETQMHNHDSLVFHYHLHHPQEPIPNIGWLLLKKG